MKEYLGDGCYAELDGQTIVLTTENGIDITNRIYLEPEVFAALVRYRAQYFGAAQSEMEGPK